MVCQKDPEYVTDQGVPNSVNGWWEKIPQSGGGMGNFTRSRFFYQVLGIWGGVNLTIRTFFKVKNIILIINNEYDLKSKLERPV